MEPKNDPTPPEQLRPADPPPAPKKRFRLEKLEERIAPKKKGGGTSNSGSSGITQEPSYCIY